MNAGLGGDMAQKVRKLEMHQKGRRSLEKLQKLQIIHAKLKCMPAWHCQVSIFGALPFLREIHHVSNSSNISERNQSCIKYLKCIIYLKHVIHLKVSEQCTVVLEGFHNPPALMHSGQIPITP